MEDSTVPMRYMDLLSTSQDNLTFKLTTLFILSHPPLESKHFCLLLSTRRNSIRDMLHVNIIIYRFSMFMMYSTTVFVETLSTPMLCPHYSYYIGIFSVAVIKHYNHKQLIECSLSFATLLVLSSTFLYPFSSTISTPNTR